MFKKIFFLFLSLFLSACSAASQTENLPTATVFPSEMSTPVPLPTSTNIHTKTPSPSATQPLPTQVSQPTVQPFRENTPIPVTNEEISLANLDRLRELSRWGKGYAKNIYFSADNTVIAVETTIGRYLYNRNTFRELPFSEELWEQLSRPQNNMQVKWVNSGIEIWQDNSLIKTIAASDPYAKSEDNTLIAGRLNSDVGVWTSKNGNLVNKFSIPPQPANYEGLYCSGVFRLAISPDKKYLAAGCYEGREIFIWEISTAKLVHQLNSQAYYTGSLAFSQDSSMLAAVVMGGYVHVWRMSDGYILRIFDDSHVNWRSSGAVYFAPDGDTLIGAFGNGEVLAWSIRSGKLLHNIHPMTPTNHALSFSPDGQLLAAASGGHLLVWNFKKAILSETIFTSVQHLGKLARMSRSPRILSGPPGNIDFIGFSKNGKNVLFIIDIGEVYVKTLNSPNQARLLEFSENDHFLGFTADGQATWISNADLTSSDFSPLEKVFSPNLQMYTISPNRQLLAQCLSDSISISNIKSGKTIGTIQVDYSLDILFSPDGNVLAYSNGETVQAFDITSGNSRYTLAQDEINLYNLAYSPRNEILATYGSDGNIYLWRASDGAFLRVLPGNPSYGGALSFSPDGKYLVATSDDGSIRIWGVTE